MGRRAQEREKARDQELDLHGTDLRRARLKGAQLGGALLYSAHLEGAVLAQAHLERAILAGAHLEDAFMRGAHLAKAFLGVLLSEDERRDEPTHLQGTDLREARLEGAFLEDAEGLTREQIAEAITDETTVLPDYLKEEGEEGADE